jgi:glycosyltransferase involved in cell wall biosynthesis
VQAAALRISAGFAAKADAVLAPSAVIRDELHARGVRAPIAVVPTGVDLERFRPGDREAARRRLGVGQGEPLVLYVGRLDREKSVDRVLGAFERVASTIPAARLVLVGQGTGRRGCGARPRACRWPSGSAFSTRPHVRWSSATAADVFLFASETGAVLAEAAVRTCRRWPSTPRAATRSFATVTPESSRGDPAALAEAASGSTRSGAPRAIGPAARGCRHL